jgi:hypothetical protein
MWYDDYFNRDGVYLGTDNSTSEQVRVMDQGAWEANKSGDGTIDHDTGVANSSLHSKSGIAEKASINIYKHYNTQNRRLIADKGEYLMQNKVASIGNEIIDNYIKVDLKNLSKDGVADQINDIISSFVHENTHGDDFNNWGISKMEKMSKETMETRALSAQAKHSSWEKTTDNYKRMMSNYANSLNVIVPGINHSFLKTSITVPLKIK